MGVVVHDVNDPYFSEIVRGVLAGAEASDRMVLICNTYRDTSRELDYIRHFRAQRVEALVLAGSGRLDREAEARIGAEIISFTRAGGRAVLVGRHDVAADAVLPDNADGARQVARHLVGLGHRKVGVVSGPAELTTNVDRLGAFREELSNLGVALPDEEVRHGGYDRDEAERAAEELISGVPNLTAIFALNDVMATGVLACLRRKGVRVPEDLSVVGFDDIPVAADLRPALTTVRVPMFEIGQRAAGLVLGPPAALPCRAPADPACGARVDRASVPMSTTKRVGVIMNGVTGRMGRNQHLARSIAAIRQDGGLQVGDVLIWPDPILGGRDEERLRRLAETHGIERYSADLESCLADERDAVYFDAQTRARREEALAAAIDAGKHVYCENPAATTSETALKLAALARAAGLGNGVVEDKLFLPGLLALDDVIQQRFFGQVMSMRVEFAYWVFPDALGTSQRPSWNYREEEGGGIVLDMFCHFRYLFDHLFGGVRSVACKALTHVAERVDEHGAEYPVTANDAAYALFDLVDGAIAQVNASWAVRPYRDDLLVVQVDGTDGSAVASFQRCLVQPGVTTPLFVWNPDLPLQSDPRANWVEVPRRLPLVNAFRRQWELLLRHVALGEPFPWDLADAARGIQLAELALIASAERRWVEVPELTCG